LSAHAGRSSAPGTKTPREENDRPPNPNESFATSGIRTDDSGVSGLVPPDRENRDDGQIDHRSLLAGRYVNRPSKERKLVRLDAVVPAQVQQPSPSVAIIATRVLALVADSWEKVTDQGRGQNQYKTKTCSSRTTAL